MNQKTRKHKKRIDNPYMKGGKLDYPPSVKDILKKYGNEKIVGISLHRLCLDSIFNKLMSILTKGKIEKYIKKHANNKFFHISMLIQLPNDTILCEKNQIINFKLNPQKSKEQEEFKIPISTNITLNELMENTRKAIGDQVFFTYDVTYNNCIKWIENILKVNQLYNEKIKKFISQNIKKIFINFPSLEKFINSITGFVGNVSITVDRLKQRLMSIPEK